MISKKDIAKLEGLLYLYALSKTGSKREVAEQLGTSVDTINKYISDLEAELKTIFLMSNGRGTIITPEGQQILKVATEMVKALRSISDYGDGAASYKGVVRLGMPDAISDYLGSQKSFDFVKKYPDIHIESEIGNKLPNMNVLEADICLNYDPPQSPDLVLVRSEKVHCGLFAAQSYIDEYGQPKDMNDLLENHRICDKQNHLLYIDGWQEKMKQAKHIVYKTNSIFSLRIMLENGIGVGICPVDYGYKKLVPVLENEFGFDINIFLIAHKDTKDIPRIRVVLDYICNILDSKYGN